MGLMDIVRYITAQQQQQAQEETPPPPAESPQPTPDSQAVAEEFHKLRMFGRPVGALTEHLRKQTLDADEPWPTVIRDEELGTLTVPSTYMGLMAAMATWDSLLLDEELVSVRNLAMNMMPMGVTYQTVRRKEMAEEKAEWDHMKEHHPDDFDHAQGGRA